jgi:CRISPR-associated protein Cas2
MPENTTFVIYDCENDRVRTKISEICLDYGLMRIQFSAFMGKLSRSMREELFLKLCAQLDESAARLLMQPICDADETLRKVKEKNVHLLGKVPPELRDQKSSHKKETDSQPSQQ